MSAHTQEENGRQPKRRGAWLRPSHQHTAFSATILLMTSTFLSRIIGLVREKIIAYFFGAGSQTDAYRAAFQLPEMITYLLVGGVASITFITLLSHYREQGKEAEGEEALSVILSTMLLVLGGAILLGEFFASSYTRIFFPGFDAEKAALCTHMTRILLPGQLFFFAGGILAAVQMVRKQFTYQALAPLLYNVGIIAGALLLAHYVGVSSLAIGALVGATAGWFLLNAIGAYRVGMRFRFQLNWSHPGLREWLRLSIPLMIGVSLVTVDSWILSYFASHGRGDIARISYAKRLFSMPMAMLGQAAGAASLPFFASLAGKGRMQEFAASVNRSVTRIFALAFLLSVWMIGLAHPAVDFVLRGGSFHHSDATETALYFSIFAGSLCMWSAQAIYARAFYAAGNTFTPMAASTLIAAASIPLYGFLFHRMGVVGLAIASDIGIMVQTVVLALLLDGRKLVDMRGLEFGELGRALLAATASSLELYLLQRVLPPAGTFPADILLLVCGTTAWFLTCWLILHVTGSTLPQQLIARFRSKSTNTPAA
ncbi:MAG TPA: murein biosynthesis integral membrane protein MurJ [Acidobacteriaceae bacterium]|nr:murein biosynthesis integral membrane protein MurJ [Acidobacteriaceae bacterium]